VFQEKGYGLIYSELKSYTRKMPLKLKVDRKLRNIDKTTTEVTDIRVTDINKYSSGGEYK